MSRNKEFKNKQPIAVFDVDDTLAEFGKGFCQYLSLQFGEKVKDDYKRWNCSLEEFYKGKIYDIGAQFEAFEQSGGMSRLEPKPLMTELLTSLSREGYLIHIITARGWMKHGPAVTAAWLDRYELKYHFMDVVPLGACKSDYIKPDTELYYEDHFHHARNSSRKVKQVFLLDYLHNRLDHVLPNNVTRMKIH